MLLGDVFPSKKKLLPVGEELMRFSVG